MMEFKKRSTTLYSFFLIVLLLTVAAESLVIYFYCWSNHKMPKIHILTSPAMIFSDTFQSDYGKGDGGEMYNILPKGTVLYDDSDSLNQRVMVYFNLEGADFKFVDQDPDILKQPVTMRPIRKEDIPRVLRDAKLSKTDLFDIISNDRDLTELEKGALYKLYKIDPNLYPATIRGVKI